MQPLDSQKHLSQLDTLDIYHSISKLHLQFDAGWQAAEFATINFDPDKIKNIIFVGMGGSNLAAEVVKGLSPFILTTPFEIISNYRLPAYADKGTLVILSSYSGYTEEVLSCGQDALVRHSLTLCLTTNGQLRSFALQNKISLIEIDDKFNPSKSPRAGMCLSLGAVLGLLTRLNPSARNLLDKRSISSTMERVIDSIAIDKNVGINPAKTLATRYRGRGLAILTANHLSGVSKVLVNYVHESAKTFAINEIIPDLNHHFLDGLTYPTNLKEDMSFLILNSPSFPEIIQKRIQLTKDILIKQKYSVTVIRPESTDPVLQVFESLAFLILFRYYLAIVNKVNPGSNPWVDYFKKELH